MTLGIEISDLTMTYGTTLALDHLDLSLAPGRIHGLLGRNGAGKSTLLSVMTGFLRPTTGTVRAGGAPVFENPRNTRKMCLVGEPGLIGDPSDRVHEVLSHAQFLRAGWDARYALELIELFDIRLKAKMSDLSRGKRSALTSVIGLASGAALTMFDESHLGMDAPARAAFSDALLRDFGRTGRTFVVSTHLIEESSPLFEDVVIIDRGRLLVHEEADRLRSRGCTVTGPTSVVESFVAGAQVLGEPRRLGGISSVVLYGRPYEQEQDRAKETGLDLEPLPLQELFIHLTRTDGRLCGEGPVDPHAQGSADHE